MRATDTPDKQEIEFMMKFFDLDGITVRNVYNENNNFDGKIMRILMKKSEEKNR